MLGCHVPFDLLIILGQPKRKAKVTRRLPAQVKGSSRMQRPRGHSAQAGVGTFTPFSRRSKHCGVPTVDSVALHWRPTARTSSRRGQTPLELLGSGGELHEEGCRIRRSLTGTSCTACAYMVSLSAHISMPRSYQHEHTRSRPISEVKHVWARLVLR